MQYFIYLKVSFYSISVHLCKKIKLFWPQDKNSTSQFWLLLLKMSFKKGADCKLSTDFTNSNKYSFNLKKHQLCFWKSVIVKYSLGIKDRHAPEQGIQSPTAPPGALQQLSCDQPALPQQVEDVVSESVSVLLQHPSHVVHHLRPATRGRQRVLHKQRQEARV